jgi:hypothetical protein
VCADTGESDICLNVKTKNMKKTAFTVIMIAASFLSGYAFKTALVQQAPKAQTPKRVTGIGVYSLSAKTPAK